MPDMLQFLQPKIESVLGRSKLNAESLFMEELVDNEADADQV